MYFKNLLAFDFLIKSFSKSLLLGPYYPFKFLNRVTKKTEIKPDLFDPHLHHFQEAFQPSRIVHL